jgi:hypothetical protein
MKNLLPLIFSLIATFAIAQDNRWSFTAEGTLNFVNATSPRAFYNDRSYRIGYNTFLRSEYNFGSRLSAVVGLGYLRTYEYYSTPVQNGPNGLEFINSDLTHHYAVVPIGIKWSLGPVFIRPEIGIGINTSNTRLDEYRYRIEPSLFIIEKRKTKENHNLALVNRMTYPLLCTIGTEIPLSFTTLIIGVQGFYTLNTIGDRYINQRHAYGLGTTVGVKF